MFARIRRSSAPASGAATVPNGAQEDGVPNTSAKHKEAAVASLAELRKALDRLDYLTVKIADKNNDDEDEEDINNNSKSKAAVKAQPAAGVTTTAVRGLGEDTFAEDEDDNVDTAKKEVDAEEINIAEDSKSSDDEAMTTSTTENNDTKNEDSTTQQPVKQEQQNSHTFVERSPSAAAADIRANANASFLAVEKADELEMIELLRRIAELVVLSERRAGQLLSSLSTSRRRGKSGESAGEPSSPSSDNEKKNEGGEEENSEDLAMPYLALFELFCERNSLANIVNIVTGAAFERKEQQQKQSSTIITESADSGGNNNTEPTTIHPKRQQRRQITFLPPLSIATQAVQSISILIQNVSRATSLYFLLSNNRVNDLIKLPLHLYKRAELNELHCRYNEKYSKQRRGKSPPPMPNLLNYQSSDMGELTTHFVSFLKSLAMRVNAETLQFFLSFPLNEVGSGSNHDDTIPEDAAKVDEQLSYLERRKVVEFPLYARALEFCSDPEQQDSFVRVTAMNVCMNIIRLVTIHGSGSGDEEDEDEMEDDNDSDVDKEGGSKKEVDDDNDCSLENGEGEEDKDSVDDDSDGAEKLEKDDGQMNGNVGEVEQKEQKQRRHLPTETPSGLLHEAPTLPLQDRIAIAQYACHPKRVADLVSPLCARLTSQFGQVEGTVRSLEEIGSAETTTTIGTTNNPTTAESTAKSSPRKKGSDEVKKPPHQLPQNNEGGKRQQRLRLHSTIRDLIANVQDELLLLDDLLRVGLISLNEQAIEMMLATFVYPMVLQPLLLPLHRFSSGSSPSKKTERSEKKEKASEDVEEETSHQQENEEEEKTSQSERSRRPLITPQSPVPFSSKSSTNNDDTDGDASSENDDDDTANNNKSKSSYPCDNMDLAPSKTAYLGLSIIFHTITNSTFRHLLLTALLHPLSPEATGGRVITALPRITVPKEMKGNSEEEGGGVCSSDDFQLEIRMDDYIKRGDDINVYTFGTEEEWGNDDTFSGDVSDACVFILAPALVDMLQYRNAEENQTITTRPNPYRNVLFASASGSDEMVALQQLATAALHLAVSSVTTSIIRRIVLPPSSASSSKLQLSKLNTPPPNEDIVKEMLTCLCRSLINKCITYDGWWKIEFSTVAAKTLMDIVSDNYDYLRLVSLMVGDIYSEAAEFLIALPSHLDNPSMIIPRPIEATAKSSPSRKRSSNLSSSDHNKSHVETWLLDRFFFDQADKSSISAVENICYLKEQGPNDSKEQYRYGLEVLSSVSSIDGTVLDLIRCEDGGSSKQRIVAIDDEMVAVAEEEGAAKLLSPFQCAQSWALACLYLDAFHVKLVKLCAAMEDEMGESGVVEPSDMVSAKLRRILSYVSSSNNMNDDDEDVGFSLAHISSKFAIALLDEGESSSSSETKNRMSGSSGAAQPVHGSAVGLVGKSAFPCVCEVSSVHASLFTGRTCISNEGVQWQSLYLVVSGKWAILAEPGHGGSGGEGRVITSCRLACLAVRKDHASAAVNNKTPARRLLLAHASLDPRPPPLFVVDKALSSHSSSGGGGPNLGRNGLRLTRSRLDLWFEDANAAGHACKILSAKIAKARSRRGIKLKEALKSAQAKLV